MVSPTVIEWKGYRFFFFSRYDGFISVDIFPYREDQYEATRQSVLNMQKYDQMIDMIGFAKLGDVIANGDPCEMVRVVKESVLR